MAMKLEIHRIQMVDHVLYLSWWRKRLRQIHATKGILNILKYICSTLAHFLPIGWAHMGTIWCARDSGPLCLMQQPLPLQSNKRHRQMGHWCLWWISYSPVFVSLFITMHRDMVFVCCWNSWIELQSHWVSGFTPWFSGSCCFDLMEFLSKNCALKKHTNLSPSKGNMLRSTCSPTCHAAIHSSCLSRSSANRFTVTRSPLMESVVRPSETQGQRSE